MPEGETMSRKRDHRSWVQQHCNGGLPTAKIICRGSRAGCNSLARDPPSQRFGAASTRATQIRKQKRPAGRFRLGVLKFYLKGAGLIRPTALITDISASLLDRPLQHFPRYHRASSQSAFEILPDWSNPRLWPDLL